MNKISAYILTYNEAEKIEPAIRSVLWADEIVVVDSYSTDGTADIAERLGARVVQIPFTGFGDLRNQAMAACTFDWIFSLDADERCTAEARDEIRAILQSEAPEDAYYVPRKNFFMGRWIRHSGYYPDYRQPQLFRKGVLSFAPDPVHESFTLNTGKIGYLSSDIWQIPFKDFEQIIEKANRYSSLGAEKMAKSGRRGGMFKALTHGLWAFLHHYVIKMGVLDGWAGFVIAFGNFEGTFYKYAKLHEMQSDFRPPGSEHL
jgi:glycosyltransferase involved in cell wall biosynthesis